MGEGRREKKRNGTVVLLVVIVAAVYLSYSYFNVIYDIVTLICMHALN